MASYLFFDDQRLLVREGLRREIGQPRLIPDSLVSETGCMVCPSMSRVWKENETSYHMFYQGFLPGGTILLAAHSVDGVHFTPRNTALQAGISHPTLPNQLLPGTHAEMAAFADMGRGPGRLKLLISEYGDLKVLPKIYESDDGIHWTLSPHPWHNVGTEPCASVLYSKQLEQYVLLCRPMWGVRRVCESRTKDFVSFTLPEVTMQADALDAPLAETYGLYGFPYKDMYMGILTMYTTKPSETWKFMEGTIDGQLVYSFDGAHWLRTLREPLMALREPFSGMLFTSDMRVDADGSILLYASGTPRTHGHFQESGAAMGVFRLREDGFICLCADSEGRVRTRETLLQGEFSLNLQAEQATCALFHGDGSPIAGFGHQDCAPFSGDCTHWKPRFAGDLSALAGQVVLIEIRMQKGRLYGVNGDFVKLVNTEAWRYEKTGVMPEKTDP